MYLSYYNLKREPFSISTDPEFLWLGEKHKEALSALKYGILANKGFLMLTGDVGTGKTTLINALLRSLGDGVRVAAVHDPGLEKLDFLNYIAGSFRIKRTFASKGEFVSYFSLFLRQHHEKNKQVLLIIDEAQRLSDDMLEEIRLLSNLERSYTKLINIFFVGQNEFNDILMKKENRALRQRITLIHTLNPLDIRETQKYIQYRLMIAGASDDIFTLPAVKETYLFSGGYPRLINIICDLALLTGYVKEKKTIDPQIIKECAKELRIPIKSYEKQQPNPSTPLPEPKRRPTAKRKSRFVWASAFLIFVFLVSASAFYYHFGGHSSAFSLEKYWHRLIDGRLPIQSDIIPKQVPVPVQEKQLDTSQKSNDETARQIKAGVEPPPAPEETVDPLPEFTSEEEFQPEPRVLADKTGITPVTEPPVQEFNEPIDIEPESDYIEDVFLNKKFNVYFEHDSYVLTQQATDNLDGIFSLCSQNPGLNLRIKGFTDSTGNFYYNLLLSNRRASAIENYFLKKGMDPSRISSSGMGPDVETGDWGRGRSNQLGRRVEIELTKGIRIQ
ncbi:MAG: AAA family ATPase [Desulfobacterales bacterium]